MSANIASETIRNIQAFGSDTDDTVDEDRNLSEGNKENKSNDELLIDELKVKKRVSRIKPFTEDLLTSPLGLQRIYEEFPQSCKFRKTKGSEAKDIKKLIMMYREWAFQLHPGLSFDDVIHKTEQLSAKAKVRSYVQNLREQERDRYATEVLGIKVSEINEEILNSISSSTYQINDHISAPPVHAVGQLTNIDRQHIDILNKLITTEQVHTSEIASNLQEEDYSAMMEGILPWEPEDYYQQINDNQIHYSNNIISQEYNILVHESHGNDDVVMINNYPPTNSFVDPQSYVEDQQHHLDHSTDSMEEVLTSPEAR